MSDKTLSQRVHNLMAECLNDKEEGALVVEGIVNDYGFNPTKIEANREEIRSILNEMPPEFHADGGGGMSFLNLCMTKDGVHWAEHPTMGALVALSIASNLGSYPMGRSLWSALPGGVPYVSFDTRVPEEAA